MERFSLLLNVVSAFNNKSVVNKNLKEYFNPVLGIITVVSD